MSGFERWITTLVQHGYTNDHQKELIDRWCERRIYRLLGSDSDILEIFYSNRYIRIQLSAVHVGKYALWTFLSTNYPWKPKTEFYLSDTVPDTPQECLNEENVWQRIIDLTHDPA